MLLKNISVFVVALLVHMGLAAEEAAEGFPVIIQQMKLSGMH